MHQLILSSVSIGLVLGKITSSRTNRQKTESHVKLPSLPYSYSALEPVFDSKTLKLQYNERFQNYADNLNIALETLEQEQPRMMKSEEHGVLSVLTNLDQIKNKALMQVIRNNGGGYLNQIIFFRSMVPKKKYEKPSKELNTLIEESFSSVQEFQKKFTEAALSIFGNGYCWLVAEVNVKNRTKKPRLQIVTTQNQDNPVMFEVEKDVVLVPILGIDMWEHTYYNKFTENREQYVQKFFTIINWPMVEENLEIGLEILKSVEESESATNKYMNSIMNKMVSEENSVKQEEAEEEEEISTTTNSATRKSSKGFRQLLQPGELFIFS
jgi:superoxide dismutase, Fe-Mn family